MEKEKLLNYVMAGLAILATVALLASAIFLFFVSGIPTQNKDLLNVVITAQITLVSLVYGWFFGSSKSSSKKDDTIAELVPPKGDVTTTTTIVSVPPTDPIDKAGG
jgi:hypothetical protein